MRTIPKLHLLLLAGGLVTPADVFAQWQIWTTTETRHVLRSAPPENTRAVRLAAARNEWESFQILVRSDEPVIGVRVETGDLRGPDGAVLPGRDARLFRQHQLRLDEGTFRNETFKPDWYPDPLIPFEHPVTGHKLEGARIQAVPFDLPGRETHGFWVDLLIPASAKPGHYSGTYRVTAANGRNFPVPVSLTVWDFELPRVATLVTEFGSPAERMRGWYRQRAAAGKEAEPTDWDAIEAQCAQLLTEHHFNATPPPSTLRPVRQPDGSFKIPAGEVQTLRAFIDRYQVNALGIPRLTTAVKDPELERDTLRAWLAAFDRLARELERPQTLFFTYIKDEPNSLDDYRYVQKWGRAVREAKSVVHVMVVEQPWTEPGTPGSDSAWGDLYGAVDIWCPLFTLQRPERGAERQALGESLWAYTALCQGPPTPWWHIDAPLLNYRVPAWMAWRDGMKGLLYWGGMSYWQKVDDPWTEAPFFVGKGVIQQGQKGRRFNGEGSLAYPARAVGYEGIVATVRLKALRDAIEDYEYLAILERAGHRAAAEEIVRPLSASWFKWEKDPALYQEARARLAAAIVALRTGPH